MARRFLHWPLAFPDVFAREAVSAITSERVRRHGRDRAAGQRREQLALAMRYVT
jgi:hypothetical protein